MCSNLLLEDVELDAAVRGAALGGGVVSHGVGLAITLVRKVLAGAALTDEVSVDCLCASLGELEVVRIGTDAVGVTGDFNFGVRVVLDPVGNLVEADGGGLVKNGASRREEAAGELPHGLLDLDGDFLHDSDGVGDSLDDGVDNGVLDVDGVVEKILTTDYVKEALAGK